MKLSRPSRLIAAFLALFSMLFMQLAIASYACPGRTMGSETKGTSSWSASADTVAMTGCDGMDSEQPALCHAHVQDPFGKQSLDKPQLPDVQPFVAAGLMVALSVVDAANFPQEPQQNPTLLARSTAPPIAIRHCCFRI